MAITKTTLAAALDANALKFVATAATGATVGGLVRIGGETSTITEIVGAQITVRMRGDFGGKVVAHVAGEPLWFGTKADLTLDPAPGTGAAGGVRDIKYYAAAGAIDVPVTKDAVAVIGVGAGGAHAMTLADPQAEGVMIHIVSASAYAHTITLATGYTAVSADSDVFTLGNLVGNAVNFMSINGKWSFMGYNHNVSEGLAGAVA